MITFDMPEAEYHALAQDSGSTIEMFLRDRGEYLEHRQGKRRDKPSAEMTGGRYFHAGFLEPYTLEQRFTIAPSRLDAGQASEDDEDALALVNRKLKTGKPAWSAFLANAGGRTKIEDPAAPVCLAAMMLAVAQHPEAGPLMFPSSEGHNEVTLAWVDEETGRPLRARLDRWLPESQRVPELKTTAHDLSMRQQQALWHRFGYHRKAAIYLDGLLQLTGKHHVMPFVFVTVHRSRPRVWVRWAAHDDPAVMVGRMEYRQALRAIAACEAADEWREPFELETGVPLELPKWAVQEAIGGATLAGVEAA